MQEIRVKYSAGKVNARAKELQDMLNSLDLAAKPTCLDELAFSFRTAGKSAYGRAIHNYMEDAADVANDLFFDELDKMVNQGDGRSEHIN